MVTKVKNSTWNSSDNLGYASVKDNGALGDGVTDDTAAFTTALATGLPVFVPPGTYLLGAISLASGKTMFGVGSTSILKAKNTIGSSLVTVNSACIFRDLAIDGNKANQVAVNSHGVTVTSAVVSKLTNLTISNTYGDGINVSGASDNVRINSCVITGFTKNGITIEAGNDITISDTVCYTSDAAASPGDGIALATTAAGSSLTAVTLDNNVCRNSIGRGIAIIGNTVKNVTNVQINNNRVANNTGHGIHLLTCQQVLISNSLVKSNGGDGVRMEGDTIQSRITNSTADSNTGTCMREVVAGSTPNNNGFVYTVNVGNGSNTVVKVGASSFILT